MNGKTELNLAVIKASVKAREVITHHQELFKSAVEKVQAGNNGEVQPKEYSQTGVEQSTKPVSGSTA